jgi:hypothetical protein
MLVLFCLDIEQILTEDRCTVCTERTVLMWNLVSIHLEILLESVQDRCMVCAERSIGSEVVLDAPDGSAM